MFFFSLWHDRLEMFVWQTYESILLIHWQDRLNVTEHALQAWNLSGTCSISFIELMWLIQAELKEREREKKNDDDACFSLIPFFTIITLIVFEQRCICERDPLPWQDAVTRSVIVNETAIKRTCSYFCLQSSHSCICIWSWHRIQKKEKKTSNWSALPSHTIKNERIIFLILYYKKKNRNECVIIILRWCVWI